MVNYGLKDKVAIITGANNPWGIGSTTAIYEYQADYDGEWGEISVDFEPYNGGRICTDY